MKKRISILVFLLLINKSFGLNNESFERLMEYSEKDTHLIKIPSLIESELKVEFKKKNFWKNIENKTDRRGRYLQNRQTLAAVIVLKGKSYPLFEQKEFLPYGQKVIALTCQNLKTKILFIMTAYGTYSNVFPWYIQYRPYTYIITNSQLIKRDKNIENEVFFASNPTIITDELPNEREVYPYYNKEKILERLYEMNVCTRPLFKLSDIEKTLKQKKDLKIYNKEFFQNLLLKKPIEKKTLTTYNNIAYYLQKANANEEAIYLLEKILEKFPNRTVAHYNLADAYWAMDDKKKAKEHYSIYIKQMKAKGKEQRIPKVVKQRVLSK